MDYPAALKEIEQQVRDLQSKGGRRIIVAGQSMGANAAVAYAASGFPLDGLAILSPGHFPELGMGKRLRNSFEKARRMVATNQGRELETFDDLNQGKQRSLKMAAATYVSYFGPDGLGAITQSIRKLPQPIPVFLAIGKSDPFFPDSKGVFDSAPAHPASRLCGSRYRPLRYAENRRHRAYQVARFARDVTRRVGTAGAEGSLFPTTISSC